MRGGLRSGLSWLRMRTLALLLVTSVAAAQDRVDFEREVRPVLADRCFPCHGPDAGKREGGLRLDTAAGTSPRASSYDACRAMTRRS
jgi:mono/diheme cytochrome c family protein